MRRKIRSLKLSVLAAFVMIFAVMACAFSVSYFMKQVIIKEYDNSINTSMAISQLSYEINDYAILFDRYIRNRKIDVYEEYKNSKEKIENYLKEIDDEIVDNQSLVFLRNLNNMYDYQSQITDAVSTEENFNEKTYEKITQAKTMFAYMSRHVQMLSFAYLDYSGKRYASLLVDYRKAENNLYLVVAFIALVIFYFAIFRLRDILSTVNNLTKSAKLLSEAHWEITDIGETYYTEFDTLALAFNSMKKNINIFIKELSQKAELELNLNKAKMKNIEKDKLLKESQLRTLQAQMDPHFLFNTLNIISRIAMFENADKSVKLIESISKILRYNLEHIGKMVSLQEEVTTLKAYAIIQETRFEERLKFNFDIDEETLNYLIPPMLIQPIMENAIIHGLRNQSKAGEIKIQTQISHGMLRIDIVDNGIGIEQEKIDEILNIKENSTNNDEKKRVGLGIGNTKKRLKLYFNRDDLMVIKSKLSEGTQITLYIPVEIS